MVLAFSELEPCTKVLRVPVVVFTVRSTPVPFISNPVVTPPTIITSNSSLVSWLLASMVPTEFSMVAPASNE